MAIDSPAANPSPKLPFISAIWRVPSDEQGPIVVDVVEVWVIGARSNASVYAEMSERVSTLPNGPSTLALAEVIQRLGKARSGLSPQGDPPPTRELPGWLIDRVGESGSE